MATASPWIRVHTSLLRNHKLIETAKDLRLKPVYLLGHLSVCWSSVLEQAEDGDVSRWSDAAFALYSDFSASRATEYALALRSRRWVVETEAPLGGHAVWVIHDWLDFAGPYLLAKYKTSHPERLVSIWHKHGRVYGPDKADGSVEGKNKGITKEVDRKHRFIHSVIDDKSTAPPSNSGKGVDSGVRYSEGGFPICTGCHTRIGDDPGEKSRHIACHQHTERPTP